MRYKKEIDKFFWIKADGRTEEITEKRFLDLEYENVNNKTKSYNLIWRMKNQIEFTDKMNTIRLPIESLKKILNLKTFIERRVNKNEGNKVQS